MAAPPRTNPKGGELAPLRIPDYGQDRVLSDATRRQSTKESHLTVGRVGLIPVAAAHLW